MNLLSRLATEAKLQPARVPRYRLVGQYHGRPPREDVRGSAREAGDHAMLFHIIGGAYQVGVLEERHNDAGPCYPWACWLLVGDRWLNQEETWAAIERQGAGDWCVPGDIALMGTYRPT